MTSTRPGFELVTTIENGHEAQVWKRCDVRREPSQDELEIELADAISLGWKSELLDGGSVVRFELLVHISNPRRTWRRWPDGRVERTWSDQSDPQPVPLGSFPKRPTSPRMFPAAPAPAPVPPTPDAFDGLDEPTRRAMIAALGLST